MFVQDLAPDAFFLCDEENGIVKISQWSSGVEDNAIDVKIEDVKRFTNTERVEDGLALMEFACQVSVRIHISSYKSLRILDLNL